MLLCMCSSCFHIIHVIVHVFILTKNKNILASTPHYHGIFKMNKYNLNIRLLPHMIQLANQLANKQRRQW